MLTTVLPAAAPSLQPILAILDQTLGLGGRAFAFTRDTRLLGELPELDSLAVVHLITRLQEELGIEIVDDELDGSVFASVGSLADFTTAKRVAEARS